MEELTTDQKGNIAEAAVKLHAIKLGIEVYEPAGEGGRFDMIFRFPNGELSRVQVKWAPLHDEVVHLRTYTCRRTGHGLARRKYTEDEIDAIAGYCPDLDRVYYVPAAVCADRTVMHLRLAPTRNGQRGSLNWAAAYELGAIAQLEERRHGMAEAVGSSPTSSTSQAENEVISAEEAQCRFGWYAERAAAGETILVTRRGKPRVRFSPP